MSLKMAYIDRAHMLYSQFLIAFPMKVKQETNYLLKLLYPMPYVVLIGGFTYIGRKASNNTALLIVPIWGSFWSSY